MGLVQSEHAAEDIEEVEARQAMFGSAFARMRSVSVHQLQFYTKKCSIVTEYIRMLPECGLYSSIWSAMQNSYDKCPAEYCSICSFSR